MFWFSRSKISSKHLDTFSFQIAIFSMMASSLTHHLVTSCSSSRASAPQETKREGRAGKPRKSLFIKRTQGFPTLCPADICLDLTHELGCILPIPLPPHHSGRLDSGEQDFHVCLRLTVIRINTLFYSYLKKKKPSNFIILLYPERQ